MFTFILKRLAVGLGLLYIVVTLVFLAVQTVPGDPALIVLSGTGNSGEISPEALAATREQLGLDRPVIVQYVDYVAGLFRGDLGTSFDNRQPVSDLLAARLPNTLELVGIVSVIAIAAGIAIGSRTARRGTAANTGLSFFTSLGISAPVYVLGTVLVFVFSVTLKWLPAGGFTSWAEDPVRHLQLLILPVTAIAIGLTSVIARVTRSSVAETTEQDWVRTSRALGLSEPVVFRTAVLRNSLTPVATIAALEIGILIGSTVLVERVFSWPGLSTLLVEGVSTRDYPVIQGVIIVTAALFILINIVVDVLYGVLDPRARQS
ncbi:ABC transporter permease [Microbacterium sp. NPDC056044]|uniref:ABC transporter permease n=1 Tax=Microbacterium sp. NPDC056044 TaxID=3345690 RepID=UPI0035E0C316